MARGFGAALGLAAPALLALAALVGIGALRTGPALVAAAFIVVMMGVIVTPAALSLAGLRRALERLEPEGSGAPPPPTGWMFRFSPAARTLWPSMLRLIRRWRHHGEALQTRLAGAEAIIAAVPNPLILIDRNRRIVRASEASAEFIGAIAEPRDLAASLRNPTVLQAADAVLRGEAARVVEFSVTVPVPRLLQARFARIDGPALDGAVAILGLHDITALKQAEQMRADFVANAGHELKTPLAALIGFIETLLGSARDDPGARERFLGIMREQARRMARLVDDLLSLSRIELNEHVAPTARVSLRVVIERVADSLELRAAERGMQLALTMPPDLPSVVGDGDELAQVFQNLLDNAIKYGRRDTEIRVAAEDAGNQVRVAVTDSGEGIPSEHLPRLTERFYRVDTARSREMGGTGLGLAIVKHIVSRHRGRLEIASTLGRGSTFTVWLPATRQPG